MMGGNEDTVGSKGILIVFEGISGCGKSENVENLRSYLAGKGYKTRVIEWNSNRIIRQMVKKMHVRNLLTPNIYSFFQWGSFLIDYLLKIRPLIKKNYILVADRYVYTGLTRDIANGAGGRLGRFLAKIIVKPDLVFFHDVDPCVCYERIKKRGKCLFHTNKAIMRNKILKNKSLYYLAKLRRIYLRLFDDPKIKNATNIILLKENNCSVLYYVEDYISGNKEMSKSI